MASYLDILWNWGAEIETYEFSLPNALKLAKGSLPLVVVMQEPCNLADGVPYENMVYGNELAEMWTAERGGCPALQEVDRLAEEASECRYSLKDFSVFDLNTLQSPDMQDDSGDLEGDLLAAHRTFWEMIKAKAPKVILVLTCKAKASQDKFVRLLWSSRTPSNIASGFEQSSIYPYNPEVVLCKLPKPKANDQGSVDLRPSSGDSSNSVLSEKDWGRLEELMESAVAHGSPQHKQMVRKLKNTMASLQIENVLLTRENKDVKDTLFEEKKRQKRGKTILQQLRAKEGTGAILSSPAKVQRAHEINAQQEAKKQVGKANNEAENIQKQLSKEFERYSKELAAIDRQMKAKEKKQKAAQEAEKKAMAKESQQASKQLANTLQALVKKDKNPLRRVVFEQPPNEDVVVNLSKTAQKQAIARFGRASNNPSTRGAMTFPIDRSYSHASRFQDSA